MGLDGSHPSPGESPQLGNPWDALIAPSLTPKVVKTDVGAPPKGGFIWKHMPFSRLSLGNIGDKEGGSPLLRYRQTRFSSRRIRKRVVFKHGDVNVVQGNVAKRRRKYLQDIFTTLVDAQWRWTLLVFTLNFMLSWLLFAVIWYLIAFSHGDLDPGITQMLNDSLSQPDWQPCVVGITGFTSCFLFSVETQHTIGYGGRSTSEECPEAIFVMCIQSVVGVMIQAFMVGIVFVKLSRPIKRTHTLLFSRHAVICQRDGVLCLMFRVGDMRKSHIIEAHVRAQLIRRKVTQEGELLPFHQEELQVGGDGVEDRIFFIWPTMIVHKILPDSPLYSLSASDMLRERFEIVVVLEGIVESTGMTTQARSSYLPNEVLWGHRFEPLVSFKKETGEYEVDYNQFNHTYQVDTPLCSASELDAVLDAAREEPGVEGKFGRRKEPSPDEVDMTSVDSRLRVPGVPASAVVVDVERRTGREEVHRRQESTREPVRFTENGYLRGLEGITIVSPLDLPGPESRI